MLSRDIKTKFAFRQIFVAEGAKQDGIIDCQEEEDEKLVFQSSDEATICRRQKITILRSSRDARIAENRANKNRPFERAEFAN